MKERLSACIGMFSVMALSNAIVPVLPVYAPGSLMQGAIFAGYFLGAFIMTLPAGLISDRYGRVPVMQVGLLVTIISGVLLFIESAPLVLIGLRVLEGLGAGLFVAASMAFVNTLPDHEQMSGYLIASLNAGLVSGLIFGGYLARHTAVPAAGIAFFTIISVIAALLSAVVSEDKKPEAGRDVLITIKTMVADFRWLWYSAIVLIGLTGVVSSLYPEFSDAAPDQAGIWIAGMSIATVLSVLLVSHLKMPPVPTIRIAALVMAAGTILTYFTPAGFVVVGAVAGIVMIAQMAFLAQAGSQQGAAMGLFSTTSYLGMSVLPFLAGIIAETTTFFLAFLIMAGTAITVSLTIGRCACQLPSKHGRLRAGERE